MTEGIRIGVTLATFVATTGFTDGRDAANYVGSKTCGICHKAESSGNQLDRWQASPHAKAVEDLDTPAAKEAGKKMGVDSPQTSPKCLRCHSTTYNFMETVATEKVKVKEGISCESCHGPGKRYMAKSVMEDRAKAIEAGMIYPASKSCLLCHNEQSPTWKSDRYTMKDGRKVGFDFEQALEKVRHSDPKVKH